MPRGFSKQIWHNLESSRALLLAMRPSIADGDMAPCSLEGGGEGGVVWREGAGTKGGGITYSVWAKKAGTLNRQNKTKTLKR